MESPAENSGGPPRFSRTGRHFWGLGYLEWVVFALSALALAAQLFTPPIIGLADNGDYGRIIEPLGLRPEAETWGDRYFLYVNREYRTVPPAAAPAFSSELLLGRLAMLLDSTFTHDDTFDLLFLGGVHAVFYLFGILLILSAGRTFSVAGRIALSVGLLVSATDVAFVSMFNSFYTESAGLIFLTLLIGIVLRDVRAGRTAWIGIGAYFAAANLLIAGKLQNLIWTPLLAALPIALHWRRSTHRMRIAIISLAVALFIWAGLLVRSSSPLLRVPVLWDTVFYSILPHSPTPEKDLREFGLDPGLARFSGTTSWNQGVPVYDTAARYGYDDIARFYLRHPDRFVQLCAVCAGSTFIRRESLLGNHTRLSGMGPRSQSGRFSGWSDFQRRLFPKSLAFLGSFFLVGLAACGREWLRAAPRSPARDTTLLVIFLIAATIAGYAICVALEGTKDLVKHLYLFQGLFDACLVAVAVYGAGHLGRILPWGFWRGVSVR